MAVQVSKRYVLGDFILEPDKRALSRAGAQVHLAHKPFQVLLYLIEHRDRMVSRRELLDQFWEGHDVYEVTLSKCVGAIRKALDDHLENPRHIETRWAEGYRYVGRVEEQFLQPEPPAFEIERTRGMKIIVEEEETIENEASGLERVISVPPPHQPLYLPAPRRVSRRAAIALGLGVIALTAGALILYHLHTTSAGQSSQPAPIRSLAVLPLRNLTDDPSNEYFSDGVTESLINSLSNVDSLKVISRGSVFRFKGQQVDPREVGKQLNVAAVLEGSVRRDENSVRVAVRLVSAEDGRVLWASETYERTLRDIFALQDEIARQVATGLRFKLSGEDMQQLTRRYTDNVEAYQLYLKGRFFWNKRTPEGLRKGIEYFEQAIRNDPNYALAYAGLADSYALLDLYNGGRQIKYLFPQAKAAAQKALEIDSSLAEAHTSLAYVKYYYDWDWSGAEAEFKRAIQLNPNYATAHQWYAEYLFYMERFDESLAEINRAQELDPFSLTINTELGSPYFYMRQYDQAIEKYRKAQEMDQHFYLATYCLALCYAQKSLFDEAINMLGGGKDVSAILGYFYAVSGRRREARNILDKLRELSKQEEFSPYSIAKIYAGLGEKDQAFAWLEKAREMRDERMVMLKVDQHLDSLRSDSRFADLERRMNLAP